ncbi:MAG TPA: ROK family protein, partial [Actinomycetota bacterium]|nr:ROK family protein [Actinomycetota bacterium]
DPHDPANRRRGALETALGAKGIVQMARELGMPAPLSPKKLLAAARRGDEKAHQVVVRIAERIALAVAAVVPVVDPELVILGGGIGRNGDLLLEPVERELRVISPFQPRLEVSALGEDAELTGAVALALQTAQDVLFTRERKAIAT